MSAAKFSINVTGNDDEIPIDSTPESLQQFINYITSALSGSRLDTVTFDVRNNQVAASGTLTCASTAADDTCAINGVTFTAKASGATGNQFNVGASDSVTATNLAAAINASASALVDGHVTAEAADEVVTVTAVVPGFAGNTITLEGTTTTLEASGARLEGGDEDDLITHTV